MAPMCPSVPINHPNLSWDPATYPHPCSKKVAPGMHFLPCFPGQTHQVCTTGQLDQSSTLVLTYSTATPPGLSSTGPALSFLFRTGQPHLLYSLGWRAVDGQHRAWGQLPI